MKIHFVRSGGVAGLRLALKLDTSSLGGAEALEIEQLVNEAKFFDLPARGASSSTAADRFVYRIEVSSRTGGPYTVTMAEQTAPERVQPLLLRLTAMALRQMHDAGDPETIDEGPPVS